MALLYVGFVDFVNELGFGAAIVQRSDLNAEDLDSLFWFGFGTSACLYLLTLVVAPAVAGLFNQPDLVPLLRFLGLSLLLTGLRTVPWNLLTRAVDFKRRSLAELLGNVAGAVVTLSLAASGFGVWALAVGTLVPNVVMTAQVFRETRWWPGSRMTFRGIRRNLSFSAAVAASRGVWYLHESSDKFVVGKFLGDHALGLYTLAARLSADLPGRLTQIINQVAFPAYARLQGDPERLARYFLISVRLTSTAVFPVSLGLFLVADDLLPVVLTAKWAGMLVPLRIICLGAVIRTIHSLAAPAVLAKGYSAMNLRYNLACLLILPPSYWVGSRFGLTGVSLVWVTVFPCLAGYWLARARGIIGYRWIELARALGPAVSASAVMVTAVLGLKSLLGGATTTARLVGCVGFGAVLYLAITVGLQRGFHANLLRLLRREAPPAA
jgi:O-antigen/teichoic acid export membrane protein